MQLFRISNFLGPVFHAALLFESCTLSHKRSPSFFLPVPFNVEFVCFNKREWKKRCKHNLEGGERGSMWYTVDRPDVIHLWPQWSVTTNFDWACWVHLFIGQLFFFFWANAMGCFKLKELHGAPNVHQPHHPTKGHRKFQRVMGSQSQQFYVKVWS